MSFRFAILTGSRPNEALSTFIADLPVPPVGILPYTAKPLPTVDVYMLDEHALLLPFLATDRKRPSELARQTVLLNADSFRIERDLRAHGLLAAIDRYSFYRGTEPAPRRPSGAYWVYGRSDIAESLYFELSPMVRGEGICAFGSRREPSLAALLTRYLDAWAGS